MYSCILRNTCDLAYIFLSPGIFAYLNYHVPRTRREILEILLKGLRRLEYRGYDSAGEGDGEILYQQSPFACQSTRLTSPCLFDGLHDDCTKCKSVS